MSKHILTYYFVTLFKSRNRPEVELYFQRYDRLSRRFLETKRDIGAPAEVVVSGTLYYGVGVVAVGGKECLQPESKLLIYNTKAF